LILCQRAKHSFGEQSGVAAIRVGAAIQGVNMAIQVKAPDLEKQARYLMSIACLVKDAAKHDELQQKARALLAEAENLRVSAL
jgi:hypothetical protein